MLSTKLSGSIFLQFNNVDYVSVDNIRIRYNPREGNDLWFVYNDIINLNRKREIPELPLTDSKLTHLSGQSQKIKKKKGRVKAKSVMCFLPETP